MNLNFEITNRLFATQVNLQDIRAVVRVIPATYKLRIHQLSLHGCAEGWQKRLRKRLRAAR